MSDGWEPLPIRKVTCNCVRCDTLHARPSVAPTQVWYVSYVGYNESAYASLLPAFDGGTVYVVYLSWKFAVAQKAEKGTPISHRLSRSSSTVLGDPDAKADGTNLRRVTDIHNKSFQIRTFWISKDLRRSVLGN